MSKNCTDKKFVLKTVCMKIYNTNKPFSAEAVTLFADTMYVDSVVPFLVRAWYLIWRIDASFMTKLFSLGSDMKYE